MIANIVMCGLFQTIRNYSVHPLATILAFASAGETDRTELYCLGGFLYDFVDVTIIFVPEWYAKSSNRRFRGGGLLGPAHAKFVLRYVKVL